jgi:hypothetical protein
MTIGTALFLALATLIVCTFIFLMTVYIKEYRREEKTIKKLVEQQEAYNKSLQGLASMPVYVYEQPTPTKKKSVVKDDFALPAIDTKKKNVN